MKKLVVVFLAAVLLLTAGCVMPIAVPVLPADSTADTMVPTAAPTTEIPAETLTEAPTEPVTEVPTESVTEAPAEPSTEAPAEPSTEAPAPVDPWSFMGELSFEQGTYKDDIGNVYTYSYGLPCILADTEGARAINADIEDIFGGQILSAHQDMEDKLSLYLIDTGYHGEVWEDVLTLIIVAHTDWGDDQYGVYSYEVSSGRWLRTRDLLDRMGIDQEEFLETCSVKFRAFFEDQYKGIPEDQRAAYGYDEFLARVDDELYVSMDLRVYPSETGELIAVAPIVSMAGADFYWHLIPLGIGG